MNSICVRGKSRATDNNSNISVGGIGSGSSSGSWWDGVRIVMMMEA